MIKKFLGRQTPFVRMFSGAVAVQAILSASNFLVGLLLVRGTSDVQYGYYVLIITTVQLSRTLQGAFIGPPMTTRLMRSDRAERARLIGGLYRDQIRLMPLIAVLPLIVGAALFVRGDLDVAIAITLIAGTAAIAAGLRRDYLRSVMFAYRLPNDVLRSDIVYAVLVVVGAYAATFTPLPAAIAALTLAFACFVGSNRLAQALWRHEPWDTRVPWGLLREIAPLGAWSAFGGGVHWVFSQGYNYLVAGSLDVAAVAALAATRLLVMPVNLLSTGIATLMLPTVTRWMQQLTPWKVFRRLALVSFGLAGLAACYLLVMWFARSWIFDVVLKKHMADRDALLALWSLIAIVMLLRDQFIHFLVARERFRLTSSVTLVSAIVSIATSLVAMHFAGVIGALLGLLVGEVLNLGGLIAFSIREAREHEPFAVGSGNDA